MGSIYVKHLTWKQELELRTQVLLDCTPRLAVGVELPGERPTGPGGRVLGHRAVQVVRRRPLVIAAPMNCYAEPGFEVAVAARAFHIE